MTGAKLYAFLATPAGLEAVSRGTGWALDRLDNDLASGALGGSRLAYRAIAVRRSTGHVRFLTSAYVSVMSRDDNESNYDLLVRELEGYSVESGLSAREGLRRAAPNHTRYGSVVVDLDDSGAYQLIVSCAGLSEEGSETYATLLAGAIKLYVMRAYAVHHA